MHFKYIFHGFIVPLSILLPIIMGILKYNKAELAPKVLLLYLGISGLINATAIVLSNYHLKNLPLLHLYTIVEAVFLLYYFRVIFKERIIKRVIAVLMVVFPLLCILNFTFLQSIYEFNTYTRPLEAIIITFFCMLYLYKSGFSENWIKQPINWFNTGILIYFPSAFIIFISSNYLIDEGNKQMNSIVWQIHAALVLIMFLIWTKAYQSIKNEG